MSESVAGVLLAGGQSRRMGGGDKALLMLAGRPLLKHVADRLVPQVETLIVSANGDPVRFAALGLPVLADETSDFPGPLAGVLAALAWMERVGVGPRLLVSLPADAPFIPRDLVARLRAALEGGASRYAAVAQSRGRRHPVISLWTLAAAAEIRAALARGERKVEAMIDRLDAVVVPFPDFEIDGRGVDPFFNVNTPEDLALAEEIWSGAAKAGGLP